jgi:hypothetical protein
MPVRLRRVRLALTVAAACVVTASTAAAQPRPLVPPELVVDDAFAPFLWLRAEGTQNYLCLPAAGGPAWTLFGPQATLFDTADRQVVTHFLSPNPAEAGLPRATWLHSRDSSAVWARATAVVTDAAWVAPGAIPWLKLEVVGATTRPHGADTLASVRFIQRINTSGGLAPASGCGATTIGARALVPYTTEYVFYRALPPWP